MRTTRGRALKRHRPSVFVAAGALFALGPYLVRPVRTEQLFAYTIFALGAPVFMARLRSVRPPSLLVIIPLLTFLLLWPVAVSVFTVGPEAALDTATLARIDNFFLPIAVLVGMSGLSNRWSRSDTDRALLAFSTTWLLALALHALLVVVHVGLVDLSPVFQPFLGASLQGESRILWERAADAGRFTGIFSSPFEAGLCYSLAFLLTIGRVSADRRIPTWELMALALVLVGGVLTLSKAFVLVGLPLALLLGVPPAIGAMARRGRVIRGLSIGAGVALVVLLPIGRLLTQWVGWTKLRRLVQLIFSDQALRVASGGRFSSEGTGTVQRRAAEVLADQPLTGLGIHVHETADNAYFEYLLVGGLPEAAVFVILLISLAYLFSRVDRQYRRLGIFLAFFLFLASSGAPVIVKNRFALAFWVAAFLILRTQPRLVETTGEVPRAAPQPFR